ncbi:MAG: prepilin-type N-terminal cleavage/methylation domain-containing protein [Eubacterium sp.]|nr:prepilin-type N-terminal cleavage/methylation domain-containing protein [Eubacterium sp.]
MENDKGFTLVELIIVIAIIAILSVTIIPTIFRFIDNARKADDVDSAGVIATAINTALSNDEVYDIVMETNVTGGNCVVLMTALNGDTEWTIGNEIDPNGVLKNLMDTTCPPPTLKYTKEIKSDNFVPAGWVVCIKDEKPVVMVSDGNVNTGVTMKAAALNPIECPDYK